MGARSAHIHVPSDLVMINTTLFRLQQLNTPSRLLLCPQTHHYYNYSGTSYSGLSLIRTQYNKPLYKGQDLRSHNMSSLIVLIHFEPPKEDNLLTKNKESGLKVSFIWRIHCRMKKLETGTPVKQEYYPIIPSCVFSRTHQCLSHSIPRYGRPRERTSCRQAMECPTSPTRPRPPPLRLCDSCLAQSPPNLDLF